MDEASIPYRPMPIRRPMVTSVARDDGSTIIESDYPLPPEARSLVHLFLDRARQHPERGFIAQREKLPSGGLGDWRSVSYGDAEHRARAIAQAMIDRGLGPDASLMVLSGPSLEHGLMMMGAHMARVPYAPISTGYSLGSESFAELRHAFDICEPKMIFADDSEAYAGALASLPLDGVEVVTLASYADLIDTAPTDAVDVSIGAITRDTHAKTIFTSGSTGAPKGVIHTHGMLTAAIAQFDAMFVAKDDDGSDPVMLWWLPWSHLGGTNTGFCMTIKDGATLHIDQGRPTPGEAEQSLRNLREFALDDFSSPPAMFSYLVMAMERDSAFRDLFFSKLRYITYGAASLSQDIFARLQALSAAVSGHRVPVTTRYGSTEAQGIALVPWPLEEVGLVGVPNAGVTLKLAPSGGRLEVRVKGPCVTPGYLNDPAATAKAFDAEGFFRTGDAARLADPNDASKGLIFDGRVTENFKLSSGTWVGVGSLRNALIEALGIVSDIVVAGIDRDDIRVLAWLRNAEAAALGELPEAAPMRELIEAPAVIAQLTERLAAYNASAGGSSRRVARVLLMQDRPMVGEITDKGYINQGETLRKRRALVDMLYAADGPGVIPEPRK